MADGAQLQQRPTQLRTTLAHVWMHTEVLRRTRVNVYEYGVL